MEEVALHTVIVSGQGTPKVFLHGWGNTLEALRPLAEIVSGDGEVHLVDLPGFGKSDKPSGVWGTADYVECLLAYLDRSKLWEVDLLGHSFGGKIAALFASKYPERVNSLVLVNASALRHIRTLPKRLKFDAIRYLGKFLKLLRDKFGLKHYENYFIPRFASADYKNAAEMKSILVKVIHEDLTQEVQSIKSKTLIIWGAQDTETPLEIGERLHHLIPNSRLVVLPEKGHHPFLDAGNHLLAYYILPFFNEHITDKLVRKSNV